MAGSTYAARSAPASRRQQQGNNEPDQHAHRQQSVAQPLGRLGANKILARALGRLRPGTAPENQADGKAAAVAMTAYTIAQPTSTSVPPDQQVDHASEPGINAERAESCGLEDDDDRLRRFPAPWELFVGTSPHKA